MIEFDHYARDFDVGQAESCKDESNFFGTRPMGQVDFGKKSSPVEVWPF